MRWKSRASAAVQVMQDAREFNRFAGAQRCAFIQGTAAFIVIGTWMRRGRVLFSVAQECGDSHVAKEV